MQDHTILSIVALVVAGLVEACAILTGQDGKLLGPFLIFAGAVAGIPAGILYEKKRNPRTTE